MIQGPTTLSISAIPSFDPLPLPPTIGTRGLKRKVQEAFEDPYDDARQRMAAVVTTRKANISTIQSLFQTCGTACGACLLLKVSNPGSHHLGSCPMISPEERNESGLMLKQITYVKPYNGACFKCHLPSGGGDQWHPAFGSKEPCPHPYLVWPMIYIIWARKEYQNKVRDALNITESWETSHNFLQWFIKGVNREPNGYQVVKWILQSELKLL